MRAGLGTVVGGPIIAPTGTRKTIIAGYAIKKLDTPTLIICPTERVLKM